MTRFADAYNDRPGYERLWEYFGLSYAGWLTIPRVLMHEMSDEWQDRMAALLEEFDEAWDGSQLQGTPQVSFKHNGRYVSVPRFLCKYRNPDREAINALKRQVECS